jgi:hypothetical protein
MRRFFYDTEFIEVAGAGKRPSLELVSIGIVGEDGSEFYAENAEVDWRQANEWVLQNVKQHLCGPKLSMHVLRDRLLAFLRPSVGDPVELWAYFADYDHVLLCWIFGAMSDLPPGMPMFTRDVKQLAMSHGNPRLPVQEGTDHHALNDALWVRLAWETLDRGRHGDAR